MVPADRLGRGTETHGAGADAMPTTLKTAAESYLRAKALSRATRNEYVSTLRRWERWGGGIPVEPLLRKDLREFLDWVHEQAVKDEGENPGRTANKAREHLRAILYWAWEQELIDAPPRFPGPRDQRDVAGRHYLTKAEINALSFATHKMGRPRGWEAPHPIGRYWRAALVVFFNYGLDTGTVWRSTPAHEPILWRHVILGSEIAGPRGEGAIAVGVALLPPGEDRQGVLPADEPGGARPPPEPYAGGPAPRRPRLSRGWGTPERSLPGAVRPRRHQAAVGDRDRRGRAVGAEGPAEDVRDVL